MLNLPFNCTTNDVTFTICNSIEALDKDIWSNLNILDNIYLSIPYLRAMEKGMSEKMGFRYLTFFDRKKKAIGISVFQLVSYRSQELLQERVPFFISGKIKNHLLGDKELKLLICGNLYACGENGYAYNGIDQDLFIKILCKSISVIKNFKNDGSKISFSLIKEFWMSSNKTFSVFKQEGFLDFNADVNMVLKVSSSWSKLEDYFTSMNTKYRTRAKAVFKKSNAIKTCTMEVVEIESHLSEIDILYKQVIKKSDYNLGILNVAVFIELKRNLGEKFIFIGYFLNEILIGFATSFLYRDILDANFVGIDYKYNHEYKLYQRMLYDYVGLAIKHKKKELRLGRTAETIKSGVGGHPHEMKLFARHRNFLPSKLLKPLISSIQPNSFELRKPFKK
jgi:hypothetical protein